MKLIKAMATVGGLTGISRIAGFVRDMLTAGILGAGPIADAFFVALKLPNFFRRVTAEGAFSVSFVPLYSEVLTQEGEETAAGFANNAFSLMLWALTVFTVLAMLAMPAVVSLIAPGFHDEPEKFNLAVELTRITFPYLLLMSLTSLLGGVMNAHDRFAPFAIAPVLFNLSLIGFLLSAHLFPSAGHALSWGVAAAGVLQFMLLFICSRRMGYRLKLMKPVMTARMKKLFKLMGPGIVGAGVVHINLFADLIMASFLASGSISYLYYADRLNQLPLSMVGIAVGTALLPMLSRALSGERMDEARNLFNRALEITLFLGIPSAVGLFFAAEPIIKVLFEHGAFDAEATKYTSAVLGCYAIGLPAYVAVKVYSSAFWSQQDTITPVKISIVVTLSNIALALVFIQFMGVVGIALATGLVAWMQIFMLHRKLKGHESLYFDERFKRSAPRMIFSAGLMGLVVAIVGHLLKDYFDDGTFHQITALATLILAGVIAYGLAVTLTGAIQIQDIKKYLRRG